MSEKLYYQLDKEGGIAWEYDLEPPAEAGVQIVHTTPPPVDMLQPRWLGGQWVDFAPRTEHEARIDSETDEAIQGWAREKGKNEAYYINCGIRLVLSKNIDSTSTDYRHYHEYAAQVELCKKAGKLKKAAL